MLIIRLFVLASLMFGAVAVHADGNASTNITNYINQGNSHAKKGNYSQALQSLNAALSLEPHNARAYKIRGHVYYAMGDYAKAFADLDHVAALVPDSANVYVDRAIVHSVSGRHGMALADIERALSLKPSSAFAQAVRKEILARASEK